MIEAVLGRALMIAESRGTHNKQELGYLPDENDLAGSIQLALQAYAIPDYQTKRRNYSINFNLHRIGRTKTRIDLHHPLHGIHKYDYYYDLADTDNINVRHGILIDHNGIRSYIKEVDDKGVTRVYDAGIPTTDELDLIATYVRQMTQRFRQEV
jgi:hypothetical protein